MFRAKELRDSGVQLQKLSEMVQGTKLVQGLIVWEFMLVIVKGIVS